MNGTVEPRREARSADSATAGDGSVARRLADVLLAAAGLLVTAPLLAVAAVGIRLASPGPVMYRAQRVARGGRLFTMYKLRTMHTEAPSDRGPVITAPRDARVFPFGAWLRRSKIDELPQLWNVLRGDMAIVGPRPEDPRIVREHFRPLHFETLHVRPGLASPGSIYNYTHGEALLAGGDPEARYVERLLPFKLALDVVYVRRRSLGYDASIIGRTCVVILGSLVGRRRFPEPPEAPEAARLVREGTT